MNCSLYTVMHRGKTTTMKFEGVLKFIIFVFVTFPLIICNGEMSCIQRAANFYSKIANNSTCLSSFSLDVYENTTTACSQICSVKYSPTEDNYIRLRIKYAADIILKLDNKKNSACNYTQSDVLIECSIDQMNLGALKSCIINRCLYEESVDTQNVLGTPYATRNETTIFPLIVASVLGGLLVGTIITSLICLKTKHITCSQEKGMGPDRDGPPLVRTSQERADSEDSEAYQKVCERTKIFLYDDSESSVYNHLHEGLKTSATSTHYSTMKNLIPDNCTKTNANEGRKQALLTKSKEKKNQNKISQTNSPENRFDKMYSSQERTLTDEYFTLEQIIT